MYEIRLGNEHPKQSRSRDENDRPIWEPSPGPSTCIVQAPGTLGETFVNVTAPGGIWENQSFDEKPTWVESDTPALAALLAEHYDVPVGAPKDVEATHYTLNGPPTNDAKTEKVK